MTRVDWANHPAVRKIDIRKLSVLMALMNQSEGKSFSEMIPSIIDANKHLTAMGLAFTNDEIKSAMLSLNSSKSPSPDGYIFLFYTKAWDVIGQNIVRAVQSFF